MFIIQIAQSNGWKQIHAVFTYFNFWNTMMDEYHNLCSSKHNIPSSTLYSIELVILYHFLLVVLGTKCLVLMTAVQV